MNTNTDFSGHTDTDFQAVGGFFSENNSIFAPRDTVGAPAWCGRH